MPPKKVPLKESLRDDDIRRFTEQQTKKKVPLKEILQSATQTPESPPKKEEAPSQSETIKPLRTYQNDVAEAVRQKNESVVSISLAENKRKEDRGENVYESSPPKAGSKILIGIVSLVLVCGGIFAILVTLKTGEENITPITAPESKSIISADLNTSLIISGQTKTGFIEGIRTQVQALGLQSGSIGNIVVTENETSTEQVSSQDFFSLITPTIPANLLRSLKDFMLGAYGNSEQNKVFLILKVNSFEVGFPAMLSWEKTLQTDLKDLLQLDISSFGFKDGFIKNKDVRVVRNTEGSVLFLYSFLDPQTIFIGSDEENFTAVLTKFNTVNVVR